MRPSPPPDRDVSHPNISGYHRPPTSLTAKRLGASLLTVSAFPFSFRGWAISIFAAQALVTLPAPAWSQSNPEPAVLTIELSDDSPPWWSRDSDLPRPQDWPDWLQACSQLNGVLTKDGWQGLEADADDETSVSLEVDRSVMEGDLALTLSFSRRQPCDFSIQLFDPDGRIVAVDLFGNVSENSVAVGTDTYIVPLARYPSASRVSVRQLSGRLVLHGLLAFPVLSELPPDPEMEMSIFELVGGQLSPESALFQSLARMLPSSENESSGTQEQSIAEMRAGSIKDLERTQEAFANRLTGTEWLLRDVFRPRLARFSAEGLMLQQHVEPGAPLEWDELQPQMGRQYRVVGSSLVQFGIGGWLATFNDNFTEVTYSNTTGGTWTGKLVGTFDVSQVVHRRESIPTYAETDPDRSNEELQSALQGQFWRVVEFRDQQFEDSYIIRFGQERLVEKWELGNRWEPFTSYRVLTNNMIRIGRHGAELRFAPDLASFAGAPTSRSITIGGEAIDPARIHELDTAARPAPDLHVPPGVTPSETFMVDSIPMKDLHALLNPATTATVLERINTHLRTSFIGKPAQIQFEAQKTRKINGKNVFAIRDRDGVLPTQYGDIPMQMIWAYFRDTSEFEPQAIRPGDSLTIRGRVSRCDFVVSAGTVRFCVDLQDSEIVAP